MEKYLKNERIQKAIGILTLIIAIALYNIYPSLTTGGILLLLAVAFFYLGCGEDKRKSK